MNRFAFDAFMIKCFLTNFVTDTRKDFVTKRDFFSYENVFVSKKLVLIKDVWEEDMLKNTFLIDYL